ncbi:MAG: polysaccharide deacetylase family protein [Bacillota bacterium]|jgi:polysaccharide deacetylase family sporulation protein PdaB
MIVKKRTILLCLLVMLWVAAAFIALKSRAVKPVVDMYDLTTAAAQNIQMPVFYVETDRKAVALTFDISWGEEMPDRVLDVLKEHDQKATFFLSGPWAKYYKDIVKRIVDEGHEIASHGQEHDNLSQLSKKAISDNIQSAHDILVNVSGVSPKYFRPPNGDYNDLVVLTARELGYETVIWSVDSRDWQRPGASYIVERVSRYTFRGAILLFHASDSAPDTPEALPMVLANLKTAGYEVMPLGELMNLGTPARDDPRGRPESELPR